jgi:phosphatidate cytidylyltransferase
LKTRILSGIVLGIITASSLIYGGWYLFGLCIGISLVGMYELYKISGLEKSVLACMGYLTAIFYYYCIIAKFEKYEIFVFVVGLMAIMSVYVFTFPRFKSDDVMLVFLGIFYVAVMLSYIYKVRDFGDGIYVVWLVFVASWGNDTFAYFTGVFFGKHKMAPKLSPKKSVEGGIGGVVGATLLGFIYGYLVSGRMSRLFLHPVYTFAVASCIGAILAIVGDLTASAIKRNHDVKDYGRLIPGHGGILDRYDSVIFTAPAVYWAVFIINRI